MEKVPTVLIIGDGHSGSTLLTLILGAHSRMVGINEFSHYVRWTDAGEECTCGRKLSDCPFWHSVFSGVDRYAPMLYEKVLPFILSREDYRVIVDGVEVSVDTERYARSTEAAFKNILKESGKAIIVDSSKDPVRAELLVRHATGLAVRIVHLVRDPRGVVYSNVKLGRSPYTYLWQWLAVNLKAGLVKRRNPQTPALTVRYEDLARDTEGTLRRLCDFIGVEYEPSMRTFREVEHHTIAGNAIRFERTAEVKEDVRWRQHLRAMPKVVVTVFGGWLAAYYRLRYGYASPART